MLNASSEQIRQFEDELGTALFKRSSRRVELTPAGTAMLARARAILGAVEQASEEARVIGLGHVGTLDIGMTGSILLGPLAPWCANSAPPIHRSMCGCMNCRRPNSTPRWSAAALIFHSCAGHRTTPTSSL